MVIEQQEPQSQHQVIQERIVRRKDDADLPGRDDQKAQNPQPPRQKHHPREPQFQHQCSKRGRCVEPVRKMLHVPANPSRQWPVLVILVQRREIAPLQVAADDFRHARFEINPEAFPNQQKQARARWLALFAPTWPKSRGREEWGNETRLQQHSVRLVSGEILGRADERQKANETNGKHAAWPEIQNQQRRGDHSRPANTREHVRPAGNPQQRRRIPIARVAEPFGQCVQVFTGGKNSMRPNQSANLKGQ